VLMCVFNVVPIFSSLLYTCLGIDCAYAFAAVTLVLVAEFAQKRQIESLEEEIAVQQKKEQEHHLLAENNARVLALEDNFVSLYEVELETGKYELYVKNGVNDHGIYSRVVKGSDFFEDTVKNVLTVVCPEDRDGLVEVLKAGHIRGVLEKESHFDYYYRLLAGDAPVWAKLRIVYKDAGKHSVIIGAFNAEEEMEARRKEEQLQQDLLERMAGDDGVFLIDCANDSRRTIHDRVHTSAEFSDARGYSANFEKYIDHFIAGSDRDTMRPLISPAYLLDCLKSRNEFSVRYRESLTGEFRWFEMRIVRVSDTKVLQSFKNIDEHIQSERAQKAISEDYFAIYIADLDNDVIRVIKRSPAFRSDSTLNENSYSKMLGEFISGLKEPDRLKWQGLDTAAGAKAFLAGLDKRELLYESAYREGSRSRATWYVLERDGGEAASVCLAFSNLDREENDREELNEQITEQKKRLEEYLTFTNYFLSTFVTAYYVNLDTREYKVYKGPVTSLGQSQLVNPDYLSALTAFFRMVVHPDDLEELTALIRPEKLKELLKQGDVAYTFRDTRNHAVKYIRMQVIRGADESHVALSFREITDEYTEQQKRLLGAVPISPDILAKESIGMWAFELDEGQPPRMYGDEAMLRLVGLDHQVTPEEMYHAWYDHIDTDSYKLVQDAVDKMMSGEHAEVQYPWHHPDGHTLIVRCGGVRNPEYTEGIRVEGTHQNVTEVLHFDDEERKALAENNARMLALEDNFVSLYDLDLETGEYEMHVKSDAKDHGIIARVVKSSSFYEDTVKNGQTVIYPEDRDRMIEVLNAGYIREALEKDNHFDFYYRLLAGDSPVWAKLRIVYKDDEKRRVIIGAFNAEEEMAAKQKDEALRETLAENNARLFALEDDFMSLYDVDLESGHYVSYDRDDFYTRNVSDNVVSATEFFDGLRTNVERVVFEDDREAVYSVQIRENIISALAEKDHIDHYYRIITEKGLMWLKMRIVYKNAEKKNVIIGIFNAEEEMAARQQEEQFREELLQTNARLFALEDNFESLYDVDMESGHYEVFVKGEFFRNNVLDKLTVPNDYFEELRANIDAVIFEDDRDGLYNTLTRESIREELARNDRFDYLYRIGSENGPVWMKIRIVYKDAGKKRIIIGVFNAEKDVEAQQLQNALDIANEANETNKQVLGFVNGIKWTYVLGDDDTVISARYDEAARGRFDIDHPDDPGAWMRNIHPDDEEDVLRSFREACSDHDGRKQYDITYRLRNAAGSYQWSKLTGRVICHDDGTRELTGITIDVTEQMEKEREQQKKLQEAFETANEANLRNEALFSMTNATPWFYEIDTSGKVVSVRYGERIRTHTNADVEDPMGWIDIVHPEDRER
ncbi:MAG: hypothetical protein CW338_10515, partial [Clostridiales bacterium]|nr:hypothetical protein [Clostridiales bacterium]